MKKVLLIGIVAISSCSKAPVCETWEISHECKSTNSEYVCLGGITHMTVKLCDKDLEKAHSGKDDVREMSPGVQQITHYIKRVQ